MQAKSVIIVGLVLFLGGLLLGFVPQYRKASRLEAELAAVQPTLLRGEIRHQAALAYLEAHQRNFGNAQKHLDHLYGAAEKLAAAGANESIRLKVEEMKSSRAAIAAALQQNDPEAVNPLASLLRTVCMELP